MTDQEINEAIARRLGWRKDGDFGWIQPQLHKEGFAIGHITLPDYCRSIEAAWEIVDQPEIGSQAVKRTIYPKPSWEWSLFKDGKMYLAEADTAPMAICLAFLKLENSPIQPSECEWLDHEPRKAR